MYKYSKDAAATGYKKRLAFIWDVFLWSFALGWEPGDVMTNDFENVIVVTKSSD